MTRARPYLICSLLGLSLFAACDETEDPSLDAGANPSLPGGTGGTTGGVGGTTGGIGGTTGGIGGTTGGIGGTTGGTGGTTGGTGGTTGGTGGSTGGTGGTTGGTGGTTGATGGTMGAMGGIGAGDCAGLPAVTDYNAKGPFADAKMFESVGPDSNYTFFRPDASLGKDGFKHPIAIWGNGIATTPDQYQLLLTHIASHGFVVLACNDTAAERPCLNTGMDWLVQQNTMGALAGKLDTSREVTIGYSWGGGAAIDTGNRPNVKATVSIHGMPPRDPGQAASLAALHSPLLLFTSTGDSFVSASMYVTPNYEMSSKVPTFYATLEENVGHLYPIDDEAVSCVAGFLLGGPCAGSEKERAPTVAFLRHFVCGDQGAKKYFFGADCTLCKAPWKSQSKPAASWQ